VPKLRPARARCCRRIGEQPQPEAGLIAMPKWLAAIIAALQELFKAKPAPKPLEPPVVVPPVVEPPAPEEPVIPDDSSFVWKPESESDGNLVVITPCTRRFVKLTVRGQAGRMTGVGNGNRQHWRFDRPGASFGKQVKVTGTEAGGVEVIWVIPDGSQRFQSR